MQRRDFSRWLLGAGVSAGLVRCAPAATGQPPAAPSAGRGAVDRTGPHLPIRGICFDLFTLFDPRSVIEAARAWFPEQASSLCELWRTRQFEYSWLRASAGQYLDFRDVTRQALEHALTAKKLTLPAAAREELVGAYCRLEPWPDARAALATWKAAGLRLAPLANYSPSMLSELIEHAGLSSMFDALISTDVLRTYKPDPRAYALGVSTLGLEREQIAFSAFGGWDAAGARWFGFPTFWMNRLGVTAETLAPGFDATGTNLTELARFVTGWAKA